MLGKGGMASVYLAIQESFGRKVALKVMNPALSADVKFGQRFLSEAKIVSQLIHPNIVTVYDVGISNEQHYLSMEYVPGLDLKTKRASLTMEESLRTIKDVAKALDYASMKGYVHRDVKPENIMLHEEDGRAVLMDFGIACLADKSSGMTQTGTAIGTPHYMSPEQAKGRAVDSRSDLYSLGVVLYLLIVGRVPYDADSAVAVGIKHISEPVPRLPNNISILQEIIDKLLAKEPLSRFQTGAELVAAIEELQNSGGPEIKSIADRRSPSGVGSHLTEAPTLISATVKAAGRFNPDNTTMPAIASAPSQKTQKIRVSKTKVETRSGSVAAVSTKANAPISGSIPAVGGKDRRNENTQKMRRTTGANKTAEGVAAVNKKQVDKKYPSGLTEAVSQTGNKAASGEFFAVDQDDVRDYSKAKSSKKFFASLLFLVFAGGVVYGAVYFKEYLPVELQAVVDSGTEKATEIRNDIYTQIGLPVSVPRVIEEKQIEEKKLDQSVVNQPEQELESGLVNVDVANTEKTHEDVDVVDAESTSSDGEEVDYERLLADVPEGSDLAKARILREQLNNDLSVSLPLANLYNGVLENFPEDKKAEWGLEELKGFHFRKIRDFFQARNLADIEKYLASLKNTFENIEGDESFRQVVTKFEAAEQAQALIDNGDEYLRLDQLTSPKGYNALESYQKALVIDDDNPLAMEGIARIVQQYEVLAREALQEENHKKAINLARRGLKINSEDEKLNELYALADSFFQTEEKIDRYYEEAEKQIATGNLLSPVGDSAYHQYKNILDIDEGSSQADRALRGLEQIVAIEIENKINRSEYPQAKELLINARTYFPSVEKFLALQVSLEKAEEAEFIASQPIISKLVVSSQTIEKIDQPMATISNVDRTIYIAFAYENFHSEATVVQAVLYDVARSFQIAQVPVVVSDVDGLKVFSIDRPVEGFSEGGYNIDLMINNKQVGTLAFRVESQSNSKASIE
ncbi:MAG: protein kinase [Cellvibrionaceae bacterium]